MKSIARRRSGLLPDLVVGVLAAALAAPLPAAVAAQSGDGIYLEQEISAPPQALLVTKMWLQGSSMRMDMGEEMSVIFEGGEAARTMFVQHPQRSYMVWTKEDMERMQQMMSRLGGMQGQPREETESGDTDAPPTFRRTGRTQQIGEWSCYEVMVEGPSVDGDMAMWFTEDLDVDWLDVMARVAESMSSWTQNPMMQAQRQDSPFDRLMRHIARARSGWESASVDLPEGFPVRIVARRPDGPETTMTVRDLELGPIPASTFQPPSGYKKLEMPHLGR